jgi:tetratricopeptide (TPR) repeat protein
VAALEQEALTLARELRGTDSFLAGAILNMLGIAFKETGDYEQARELHEQHKAMAEALGDRAGVATACGNLGNCYTRTGDYGRARELHEQHKAMAEALGDRAGVATACGNLGNCNTLERD